ncbi:hypothetical protein ACWCQN_43915 [Streptomyces sp. NPDC001984]
MSLRLLILDHPRIWLLLSPLVLALASASGGQAHLHRAPTHGKEPDSAGPVPRDPPPTEDMPEEVKEPPTAPEKGEADDSKEDGKIQEPPD